MIENQLSGDGVRGRERPRLLVVHLESPAGKRERCRSVEERERLEVDPRALQSAHERERELYVPARRAEGKSCDVCLGHLLIVGGKIGAWLGEHVPRCPATRFR